MRQQELEWPVRKRGGREMKRGRGAEHGRGTGRQKHPSNVLLVIQNSQKERRVSKGKVPADARLLDLALDGGPGLEEKPNHGDMTVANGLDERGDAREVASIAAVRALLLDEEQRVATLRGGVSVAPGPCRFERTLREE